MLSWNAGMPQSGGPSDELHQSASKRWSAFLGEEPFRTTTATRNEFELNRWFYRAIENLI